MVKEQNEESLNREEENEVDKGFIGRISEYINEESDKKNIYIQYRIYNNHGVMTGDDAKFENIDFKSSALSGKKHYKKSIFEDNNALSQWLTEYYGTSSMALMIAVAVFDSFPYTWVIQASEKLFREFEHYEEEKCTYALEKTLSQFGAEICKGKMNTYTGNVPIDTIRLLKTEYQEKILKYIWQQYPQLQDTIIRWLQSYNTQRPASMAKRALETMGLLACWDYYYFLNNMVPQIASDKSVVTDMMVGQILITLNQRKDYKDNVYNLLHIWSKDRQIHYLLTALFVCAQLQDKNDILKEAIGCYIQRALEEIHNNDVAKYQSELYDFLGVGIRSYTFYRLLVEQVYDKVVANISMREKRDVYGLFLKLFAIDVSQTNIEGGEDVILIRLCWTNQVVTEQICFIWQMVWQSSYYRKLLYDLMALYDARIYKIGSAYSVEKFIRKVLRSTYTKEMQMDICNKIHRRAGNE